MCSADVFQLDDERCCFLAWPNTTGKMTRVTNRTTLLLLLQMPHLLDECPQHSPRWPTCLWQRSPHHPPPYNSTCQASPIPRTNSCRQDRGSSYKMCRRCSIGLPSLPNLPETLLDVIAPHHWKKIRVHTQHPRQNISYMDWFPERLWVCKPTHLRYSIFTKPKSCHTPARSSCLLPHVSMILAACRCRQ